MDSARCQFGVFFAGVLAISLQEDTHVLLNPTTNISPYKLCVLGIEELSFEVQECQEGNLTLYDEMYNPSQKIRIRFSFGSRSQIDVFIYEMQSAWEFVNKTIINLDTCSNPIQLQINLAKNWLNVKHWSIALNILQNNIKKISYVTVSSDSVVETGLWRFDIPKSDLRPLITDSTIHQPGGVCPLRSCDYTRVMSDNCGISYSMLVPRCDNNIIYLPYKWCKGYESCGRAFTIMGCFSTDDSCQSCNIINFSDEIYINYCKQNQRIAIARTDSCEEFQKLWSAYFTIGYEEDAIDELLTTFPTSTNRNSKSTPDNDVITKDLTTMADYGITTEATTSSFVTTGEITFAEQTNAETVVSGKIIGIVGGTVGGIVFIIVMTTLVCFVIRRSHKKDKKGNPVERQNGSSNQHDNGQFSQENYAQLNLRQDSHKYGVIEKQSSVQHEQMTYEYIDSDTEPHLPKPAEPNLNLVHQDDPYVELDKIHTENKQNIGTDYMKLDPTETGFYRSNINPDRNVKATKYNGINANETGFHCSIISSDHPVKTDHYNVLDPDETGFDRSKNDTNKMQVPTTANYDVLDPTETGYCRSKLSSDHAVRTDHYNVLDPDETAFDRSKNDIIKMHVPTTANNDPLDPTETGYSLSNACSDLSVNDNDYNVIDLEETAFDRSNAHSKQTEYFVLDPSKTKVIPANVDIDSTLKGTNYVILDAKETGFDRANRNRPIEVVVEGTSVETKLSSDNTANRGFVYDLAKPTNHDRSQMGKLAKDSDPLKDMVPENIYSHAHDNVYDTANQGKRSNHFDETYDHFIKDGR